MNKKYYVYVYLDPLKTGSFKYGNLEFGYEPFYVGKGTGNRSKVHVYIAKTHKFDSNREKILRIRQILAAGQQPIILLLKKELSHEEAIQEEIQTIKIIGRKCDNKDNPLLNLTAGGDGGLEPSKETRKKQSVAKIGRIISKDVRDKMRESHLGEKNHFFGKKHSDETKQLISQHRKGKICGIEHPMFNKTHTLEARIKISESRKKYHGINHHNSRGYELISPEGKVITFYGAFDKNCFQLGIKSPSYLRQVAQGKRENYQGWKCRFVK